MSKQYLDKSGLAYFWSKLKAYFQEKLVSGTNIKTVNNQSLLGSGNVSTNSGTITGVKTTAGAHSTINVSSGAANFNVPTAASHVGAVADCTIGLYNGQGGNPGACKFCTVDYSSCDSNNGVLVKITMMAGHGNGTSYNHYQDAIISVGYTGTVSVNIYRYYAQAVTYESTTHYYGDIFYTIDTTNKVVTFYDLMGQYSHVYQAPYKKMNGSGRGTVTQFSGTAVHYSSGTKTYANIFWMDGRTKQDTLVSGTNIKTVNGVSLLGSGDVPVSGGGAVSGVKGNAESSYRTGDVNLTPANIGALPLSGGTMTGNINHNTENAVAQNWRPGNANYYTTLSYQTAGNEAAVFATKNDVTSFMFVNGEDSVTNHSTNRWQSLTPALQIKNNKIAIGKLIANNVTPTYPLDVNGTVNATSYEGSGTNLTGVVHSVKTVNGNSVEGSGNVSVGTVTGVTAGTGLSGGGTSGSVTLNHSNSITAGTIGSSDASLGSAVRIPYATYDSNGHITGKGEHTHVITGFLEGSSGTSGSTGITMGRWKLIWGDETMTTSSASGSGTFTEPYYVDRTLYVTFGATPYVWCEVNGNFTGTRYANACDVSETEFTIRLFASAKNSAVTHVRWFALGRAS